jgi:hypothetical protein
MAARRFRFACAALSKLSSSLRAIAARTVPAQVRKSFAVTFLPGNILEVIIYVAYVTSWQLPVSSTY